MRKVCPNFDREDALDTVLEVPIPEEMFANSQQKSTVMISWHNIKSWMKSPNSQPSHASMTAIFGNRNAEIQLLLGVIGAPLIPFPIPTHHQLVNTNIIDLHIVSLYLPIN